MAHYELRIAYSPATPLGEAGVLARGRDIRDIAPVFASCTAPFKQVLWVDNDGNPDWLDELEEQVLVEACDEHGLEIVEVDGDA